MRKLPRQEDSAAKRRKSAAHGASRGLANPDSSAPEGRKKLTHRPSNEIHLIAIPIADEIRPRDSIADKLLNALRRHHLRFQAGDILS